MTKEADSKPSSPHTALLGRKMGAGRGFVLILESCVSKEKCWGSEKDSQAPRGAKACFGGEEDDGTAGSWRLALATRRKSQALILMIS